MTNGEHVNGDPLDELFDETAFALASAERLRQIPPGPDDATAFHSLMVGTLEFIFYPNLIYPIKEREINQGRKRIDVYYVNAATIGFFYRAHNARQIASNRIMVECKNYSTDPANPEVDQLIGRFSVNRGKFGFLVCRRIENRRLLVERCRDAAQAGQGFILPLGDEDIVHFLDCILQRRRQDIDFWLERRLDELLT